LSIVFDDSGPDRTNNNVTEGKSNKGRHELKKYKLKVLELNKT